MLSQKKQTISIDHLAIIIGVMKFWDQNIPLLAYEWRNDSLKNIRINLIHCNISDDDLKKIVIFLNRIPGIYSLHLHLADNHIGPEGMEYFAKYFLNHQCPNELKLNLQHNKIGDLGSKYLAHALKKHTPTLLHISLDCNEISHHGAKSLAAMLQCGHMPKGLKLSLNNNRIGNEGIKYLALALKSGKSPEGLQLHLMHTHLNDESLIFFAEAFVQGRVPKEVKLNLGRNHISDIGAINLVKSLKKPRSPKNLYLGLENNHIETKGAYAFIALFCGCSAPINLQIDLTENPLPNYLLSLLLQLENKNVIKHAGRSCVMFHRASYDSHHIISKLPLELLFMIYCYVFPYPEQVIEKKYFAINIIRFFQPSHHDNPTKTAKNYKNQQRTTRPCTLL